MRTRTFVYTYILWNIASRRPKKHYDKKWNGKVSGRLTFYWFYAWSGLTASICVCTDDCILGLFFFFFFARIGYRVSSSTKCVCLQQREDFEDEVSFIYIYVYRKTRTPTWSLYLFHSLSFSLEGFIFKVLLFCRIQGGYIMFYKSGGVERIALRGW